MNENAQDGLAAPSCMDGSITPPANMADCANMAVGEMMICVSGDTVPADLPGTRHPRDNHEPDRSMIDGAAFSVGNRRLQAAQPSLSPAAARRCAAWCPAGPPP